MLQTGGNSVNNGLLATIAQKQQKQKMENTMTLPLDIRYAYNIDFNNPGNYTLTVGSGSDEFQNFPANMSYPFTIGTPQNAPLAIFPTIADAAAYYVPIASPLILASVNSNCNNQYALSGNYFPWVFSEDNRRLSALEARPIGSGTRTQSALTLSMVGTGATGTQIDATHDALISVTVSTSATASIAGAATSTVALKICATNNATEGSWTTVQTSETSQSYALAIALSGVTGGKGSLTSLVPAGWYAKLVNSGSGTHSETFISGQKTIFS